MSKNLYYISDERVKIGESTLLAKFCLAKALLDHDSTQDIIITSYHFREARSLIDVLAAALSRIGIKHNVTTSTDDKGITFNNFDGSPVVIRAIPINQWEETKASVLIVDEFNCVPTETVNAMSQEYEIRDVDGLSLQLYLPLGTPKTFRIKELV